MSATIAELAQELDTTADDIALLMSNDSKNYRWYPAGNPQKVVIVSRHSKPRKTFTISRTGKLSKFYPSWEPVLTELSKRKAAAGVSRMSHAGLATGAIPEE